MPQSRDEFVAALFVLIVLAALAIVALGRLVVWVAATVERWRAGRPAPAVMSRAAAEPAPSAPGSAPVPPVHEPANERFEPVPTPNGDGSPFPDVFAVLAVLVEGGALSATRAYELLGVSRGSSPAYKEAQARLAAARVKASGQPKFQELDEQSRPTGRVVGRRRRA